MPIRTLVSYLTLGRGGEEQLAYVSEGGGEKSNYLRAKEGRKCGGGEENEQGRQLRKGVRSQRKGNGWEVTVRTSV